MKRAEAVGKRIEWDGDHWEVIGAGVEESGATFCHLMSLTRGRQQRNGWVANQINDFVPDDVLMASE